MAGEYQLFKPRKYVDSADWGSDMKAKLIVFGELDKTGTERADDLQHFLSEVVWSVIRGELSVSRAVEFVSKMPLTTHEPLQRLFADVLWLVGFAATEAPPDRSMREEFYALCASLEKEALLPRSMLALTLETESVPSAVCQMATLKKKHNQAKTKARYTITRYNLLREHTEGYANLMFLLDRLANLGFEPDATVQQVEQTQACLVEDIIRLVGFSHLCPNRMLSMVLDIYEQWLKASDTNPSNQSLLALIRRLPLKRLTEVVVFQLLAHNPPPSTGRDPRPVQPQPPPSRPSQFLTVATLISAGLVDMDVVWSYLDPADAVLAQAHTELMSKYEDEVAAMSKVDLGSSSSTTSKDRNSFARALQTFNQAGYQKFRLVAALISVNCWSSAHKALLHLQKLCKPCLNHHIRSSLCDLLKWLIMPMMKPTMKRSPHQTKPTLETSYKCTRRFSYGVAGVDSTGGKGGDSTEEASLRQGADFEQVIPQMRQVLDHLEYFLHTDLHLLISLWRVFLMYMKGREKAGSHIVLDDALVAVIYRHLLPAASLVPHNPQLSDLMWSVMQQLSVFQRFLIYSCWETMYESFLLKFVYEKTKAATKQILKRVVANAERRDLIAHQSHFQVCKLCHSNPIPAIETMLRDVEIGFNVNMIQPYVECTNRCPEMTADVMSFVLSRSCARPTGPNRVFLSQAHATLSPWLVNLGEFVGRFYKKHPHTDLHGLLSVIAKRINSEAAETGATPDTEYKGESLIRVILENLIEFMGGYFTVADMNAEQLYCLAGGPRLKSESIAIGKKEDSSRKERARQALLTALVDLNLVPVLWYSLSQQRHHFLSEEFSEVHGGAGGLKLLGLLFDGNHECFLKLTEFLAQACSREKYMSLLPPFQEVFSMFEPALAFLAIRHGLPETPATAAMAVPVPPGAASTSMNDSSEGVADNSSSVGAGPADPATAAEEKTFNELERVIRMYLPKSLEDDGLSMQFYITFWRLSLQDIFTPTEGYEKMIAQISTNIKTIDVSKKNMERDRDHTHSRDYKALKKEATRLQDFHSKLKEEQLSQAYNHQKVIARLEKEKHMWFLMPSPQATSALVAEMICPRVLTSYPDALFCCHFVRLLIKLKTPGFQLLDFYNSWTVMLTQCIRCCSEREAQVFGVFLREMMSYVLHLRRDETQYLAEMKDNPCFHRNYYPDPTAVTVEWAQFNDIRKGHSKWEGRIYKAMRQGLDSEDWMEKRNALLLLSQCYECFPVVEKYARAVLQSVEIMRDKEELSDVKTLATSLAVKLRGQRERWLDKAPSNPEHVRRSDESRRAKNPLASVPAQVPTDGKRPLERGEPPAPERRSRREGDEVKADATAPQGAEKAAKEARESKEHKEGKEVKEVKDGKTTREHTESKTSREPKEARAADKESKRLAAREKDRDRDKQDRPVKGTGEKDVQNGDRKRGTGTTTSSTAGTVAATPHADERPEKRRRADDGSGHAKAAAISSIRSGGASSGAGERGAGDRHGSGSFHQPRNALTSAQEPAGSNSAYYRSGPPSHDYQRRSGGYPGHPSSHSGSRYSETHRRR